MEMCFTPHSKESLFLPRHLQVLSCHIPFLVSSVEDFKDHIPRETDMKVTLKSAKTTFKRCRRLCASMWPHAYFLCFQVAMNVYELSSAAGLPCEIDPALVVALSSQKSGENRLHLCILLSLWGFFTCCLCLELRYAWCVKALVSPCREHQSRGGIQNRLSADGVCGRLLANTGQQCDVPIQPRHRR